MIIICHNNNIIKSVFDFDTNEAIAFPLISISSGILNLAEKFPKRLLIWCHEDVHELLNVFKIESLFHHKKIMMSYNPVCNYLPNAIGYVDESIFINVNKEVSYPTWQMSGLVGGVYAEVLLAIKKDLNVKDKFEYFLNSIAKLIMSLGVFCYSEPKLLTKKNIDYFKYTSNYTLFKFVKQHYRTRWIFLLFLNFFLYEKRIILFPFLKSFFYKRRKIYKHKLDVIDIASSKIVVEKKELDVIIPTIGRKFFLYDVLKDFSQQTFLPKKIIIVEQNPQIDGASELDYLVNKDWPFVIEHIFIHQSGACNARNLALNKVNSEWVFMADDDVRFDSDFVMNFFDEIKNLGNEVFTISCLRKGERPFFEKIFQWGTFGSGCSIVKKSVLENVKYDLRYEFGFGEDMDFGMQLRNNGYDVLFLPNPTLLHLKAPIGGFRIKPVLAWDSDSIQPKPSPTIMLYRFLYHTSEQILGYKTTLFYKFYRLQNAKNPINYLKMMRSQWERSLYWANKLKNN